MAKTNQTPLMKQYDENVCKVSAESSSLELCRTAATFMQMKRKHPDAVLLFRVGDFYETFSDDAIVCSDILGITLTRRANGVNNYIELAGFPHHALDTYLPKLVRAGKRVAICEQVHAPQMQKRFGKTSVTELVTSGKPNAPIKEVPITKAVKEVKKATAPICRQLTIDFDF